MIERLNVHLHLQGEIIEVGELVQSNRRYYFKYYPDFIARELPVSPFHLPLSDQTFEGDPRLFDGMFGLFHDSLPDAWGQLLTNRKLQSMGVDLGSVGLLDRLSFIGDRGVGALVYEPNNNDFEHKWRDLKLERLAQGVDAVLSGNSADVIDELFHIGGSSGGARPKVEVGYNSQTDQLVHGATVLPPGFEHWIIKFPAKVDPPDIAQIEYAYHQMASAAGIEMSTCKLFTTSGGNHYFGTKRFDRIGNDRLHVHTASGIMNDNHIHSQMDYGHLMDCAFRLERHVKVYKTILARATFNVFAHNRDDHSKNFSFLMDKTGKWKVAPAYDLTYSTSSHGHHSTTVNGEGLNPALVHLKALGTKFGVERVDEVIEPVRSAIASWLIIAKDAGVSKDSREQIQRAIDSI